MMKSLLVAMILCSTFLIGTTMTVDAIKAPIRVGNAFLPVGKTQQSHSVSAFMPFGKKQQQHQHQHHHDCHYLTTTGSSSTNSTNTKLPVRGGMTMTSWLYSFSTTIDGWIKYSITVIVSAMTAVKVATKVGTFHNDGMKTFSSAHENGLMAVSSAHEKGLTSIGLGIGLGLASISLGLVCSALINNWVSLNKNSNTSDSSSKK